MGVTDMNGDGLDDIIRLHQTRTLIIDYQVPGANFTGYNYGNLVGTQWSMCIADADKNGYNDVFTGGAYNGLKLLKANSSGTEYTLNTLSVLPVFLQGSNFADINNDGSVDIFACHDDGLSLPYANNGSGVFTHDPNLINPESTVPSDNSGNYGSIWTDYDSDGDLDLYISKCRLGITDPMDGRRLNLLFENNGNNQFSDVAESVGLRPLGQSWAADFADIDNDGDLDCFVINHDINDNLYINNGQGQFTDIINSSGMVPELNAAGEGIQVKFADFDNDGFLDLLYTTNGLNHCLFRNNGDYTFTNFAAAFPTTDRIHSAATGDLNNDGFIDIIASFGNGHNGWNASIDDKLFLNNGNDNSFLKVQLHGQASNVNGIGARLELYGAWGVQVREVRSGESYGIMTSMTQHFGIGQATGIDSLLVKWPSGVVDRVIAPSFNTTISINEGDLCNSFVAFQASIQSLEVQFSDQSTVGATSWMWTFGDGTTSTEENPTHTFASPDIYQVCLTVSGICGSGQICKDINVSCSIPLSAFGNTINNQTVAFEDQSTNIPDQWLWNFGDGMTSTVANPLHAYTEPGSYLVCLTVTNECGSDQSCNLITLGCAGASAAFTFEADEFVLEFSGESTVSGLDWNWDFGGGNTDQGIFVTHTFPGPGVYPVCLQVTTNCGPLTYCEEVEVTCAPPPANFNYGSSDLNYSFISDANPDIDIWSWDFGDGTFSNFPNPLHSFPTFGQYEVCLTVGNDCGMSETCQIINVACDPPQANFGMSVDELVIELSDLSVLNPMEWLWDFGDGNTSAEINTTHTYNLPGTYEVCLTVSGDCGSSESCQTVTVSCAAPEANFFTDPIALQLNCVDLSTNNPTSWLWDFGDGSSSTEQSPSHTYDAPGSYGVCLVATSICGSTEFCQVISISCTAPGAGFSFEDDDLNVDFTDLSVNGPTQWLWNFGDGTGSTEPSPQHAYTSPGTYEVCLTVSSICGNTQSCETITISCQEPVAAYNFTADELALSFTDNSTGNVSNWMWTFGDGSTSSQVNPQHTYALPGNYQVCLSVTGICGTTQSCQTISISCAPPTPDFGITIDELTVNLLDQSTGAPTSWQWALSDGTVVSTSEFAHTFDTPGEYEICLTVSNICGTNTDCTIITVSCAAPQAAFTNSADELAVSFTDLTTVNPTAWSWDFGDGSISDLASPMHTYALPGNYTVCLTASSICGMMTTCEEISVSCAAPQGSFTNTINSLEASFSASSSDEVDTWAWNFGDGATASGAEVSHIYELPGEYTVCVTITNLCGSSESCETITVNCVAPMALFSVNGDSLTQIFNDASTNVPTQWLWDFGDGNISTEQHPIHTYAEATSYLVCLLATNACGMDTVCQTILIINTIQDPSQQIELTISPNPTSSKVQLNYQLTTASQLDLTIFNSQGKKVQQQSWLGINGADTQYVDLSGLPAGLYHFLLRDEYGKWAMGKVMKL
ncbi:MAG: hypothetical protein DHS20C18_08810 [Saprospiraceae bacterium]|nr:MAG: hypothetical protein DHS20C18_08810 [Saprospiraceae bacterium]